MNKDNLVKINYELYARKSSEAEDRQILSIDSQIDEGTKLGKKYDINVGDENIIYESRSAKTPYDRPRFEELIKKIESGKTQGIITWHPNRLSRNPIDAARLVDLMDRGKLVEIITAQQTFRNTPNDKFVFALLCLQAKMENDNKSIDVKRGLRRKYEQGYPPCMSKVGYINDKSGKKGEKKWINDEERQPIVKKILGTFLKGGYSVRKLCKYADGTLCLRTIQREKEGGKALSLSAIYNLLSDSFYAGFFYAKDEDGLKKRYEANESLNRLITEEQYWRIQAMLGKKGKPCPSKYTESFPYKRFMKCGSCGGPITAEHKFQLICPECKYKFSYPNKAECPRCEIKIEDMENPKYLHYIFYHCLRKVNPDCRKTMQETEIDKYASDYFQNNLEISPALRDWCVDNFYTIVQGDKQNEVERRITWENEKNIKEKQYLELISMKTKSLIEEDDFVRMQSLIKTEIKKAEDSLSSMGGSTTKVMADAKKFFTFAVGLSELFRNGGFKDKDGALSEICSNLTLKDRKTTIQEQNNYLILKKCIQESKQKNKSFEPKKYEGNKGKTESFDSVCPTWLRS